MFLLVLCLLVVSVSFVNGANETSCVPVSTHKDTSSILRNLRREMLSEGIGVYVVFSDDEHGSEYTQPFDKRRDWLTGFRGSAGVAVVSLRTAALWTDGRYFTQAEEEVDCANWLLMRDGNPGVPSILSWLVSETNQTNTVRSIVCHRRLDASFVVPVAGLNACVHLLFVVVNSQRCFENG